MEEKVRIEVLRVVKDRAHVRYSQAKGDKSGEVSRNPIRQGLLGYSKASEFYPR